MQVLFEVFCLLENILKLKFFSVLNAVYLILEYFHRRELYGRGFIYLTF